MGTLTKEMFKLQDSNSWFSQLSTEQRDIFCDEYDFPEYGSGELQNWMVKHMHQEEVIQKQIDDFESLLDSLDGNNSTNGKCVNKCGNYPNCKPCGIITENTKLGLLETLSECIKAMENDNIEVMKEYALSLIEKLKLI